MKMTLNKPNKQAHQVLIKKNKKLSVNIDESLHRKFKEKCFMNGDEMSTIILKAIKNYTDNN